jgi:UDP-glucose 4-epimerase
MKQGMVSIYLSFFYRDEKLVIKGPTDRFRDFIYIDDVVDAWMEAKDSSETYGEVYNLGRGEKITVDELVDVIKDNYGVDEYPTDVVDGTPGDQFGIYADTTKFEDHVGWKATTSLDDGIKNMIDTVE